MNLLTIMLWQAAVPQQSGSAMWIMLIAMFVIMYFFMIRPQNKKQKEIANFRKALQVNQHVITMRWYSRCGERDKRQRCSARNRQQRENPHRQKLDFCRRCRCQQQPSCQINKRGVLPLFFRKFHLLELVTSHVGP